MTSAQTILDAAIASSLANDGGTTVLANSTSELLGVLSRVVRQVYTLAAVDRPSGFNRDGGMFVRTGTVTMGTPATTRVAFPTDAVRLLSIVDAGGDYVAMVSVGDLRVEVAELPPAVVVADRTVRSAGRTGDPTAGASLTVDYAYVPAMMTATTDTIGATTPSDASTSSWPSEVGDSFLVRWLARYLAIKDGTRDQTEIDQLTAQLGQDASALGSLLGVDAAKLATVQTQ